MCKKNEIRPWLREEKASVFWKAESAIKLAAMTVIMLFVMSYNLVKKEDNLPVVSASIIGLTLPFIYDIPLLLSYLIARFPE